MAEFKVANHTISIVSAAGLAWALAQAWATWKGEVRRIDHIEQRLNSMPPAIAPGDQFTCSDHLFFLYQLRELNPRLNIPAPRKACRPSPP